MMTAAEVIVKSVEAAEDVLSTNEEKRKKHNKNKERKKEQKKRRAQANDEAAAGARLKDSERRRLYGAATILAELSRSKDRRNALLECEKADVTSSCSNNKARADEKESGDAPCLVRWLLIDEPASCSALALFVSHLLWDEAWRCVLFALQQPELECTLAKWFARACFHSGEEVERRTDVLDKAMKSHTTTETSHDATNNNSLKAMADGTHVGGMEREGSGWPLLVRSSLFAVFNFWQGRKSVRKEIFHRLHAAGLLDIVATLLDSQDADSSKCAMSILKNGVSIMNGLSPSEFSCPTLLAALIYTPQFRHFEELQVSGSMVTMGFDASSEAVAFLVLLLQLDPSWRSHFMDGADGLGGKAGVELMLDGIGENVLGKHLREMTMREHKMQRRNPSTFHENIPSANTKTTLAECTLCGKSQAALVGQKLRTCSVCHQAWYCDPVNAHVF
jgi:hypothetical protein